MARFSAQGAHAVLLIAFVAVAIGLLVGCGTGSSTPPGNVAAHAPAATNTALPTATNTFVPTPTNKPAPPPPPKPTATPTPTPPPAPSPYELNDTDPSISYTSHWGVYYASPYYGGDHHNTTTSGESFNYVFTGVSVTLVTATNSANGVFSCSVDGHFARDINLYSSSIQFQVEFRIASGLSNQPHVVSCVTTSGAVYYDVDALKINY